MNLNGTPLFKLFGLLMISTCFYHCQPSINGEQQQEKVKVEAEKTNAPEKSTTISDPEAESSEKISDSTSAKNQFAEAIRKVGAIDYDLKKYEEVDPSKNFLTNKIDRLNQYRKRQQRALIPQVDLSGVTKVRRAFIKGTKDLGGKVYARADVESWEMTSNASALSTYKAIQAIQESHNWEAISKSPITCFRLNEEIIFITPGGFYMLDKVAAIHDFLIEHL